MSEKKQAAHAGQAAKGQQKNVTADEQTRRGVYSNQAIVSHARDEFQFDFFFFAPLHPNQGQLVSRVILSPAHAKRFLVALQENLRKYEGRHGALPEPERGTEGPPTIQ